MGAPASRSLSLTFTISPEMDANAAGELLLEYVNSKARWGYLTREFERGEFHEVKGLPPLTVRTCCCGWYAQIPSQYESICWYRSDELGLNLFLYWEGDGTIVIQHHDWMLENSDCKKSDEWEWVNDRHWTADLPEDYYADELGPWA